MIFLKGLILFLFQLQLLREVARREEQVIAL